MATVDALPDGEDTMGLRDVSKAVEAHRRAVEKADEAEAARDEAIRDALDDGVAVVRLVEATGLSRGRIYQIRDRTR